MYSSAKNILMIKIRNVKKNKFPPTFTAQWLNLVALFCSLLTRVLINRRKRRQKNITKKRSK